MSKKANNLGYLNGKAIGLATAAKDVAEARVAELEAQLVATRAKDATSALQAPAAPPPPPPPPPSHFEVYKRLQAESPYLAAEYILNHQNEVVQEAQARRGGK